MGNLCAVLKKAPSLSRWRMVLYTCHLKAHAVIRDVSKTICEDFTVLVSTESFAAWLCQGDCVRVSFLSAIMQNIAYLYIWFLFSIAFATPATKDQVKIPQRSRAINNEVADAAPWDGVGARGWQLAHHSCLTSSPHLWHMLSNTDPPCFTTSALHLCWGFTLV